MQNTQKTSNFKYLNEYATPYKWRIVLLILIATVSSISVIALALFSRNILNITLEGTGNNLLVQIVGCGLTLLILVLCNIFSSRLNLTCSAKMGNRMTSDLWNTLMHKQYGEITKHHSGELLNLMSNDANIACSNYVSFLPNLISSLLKLVLGCLAIVIIDYRFALICFALSMVIGIVITIMRNPYKKAHTEVQKTLGESYALLQESISNVEAVKTLDMSYPLRSQLDNSLDKNYRARVRRLKIGITADAIVFTGFNAAFYVTIILGAFSVSKQSIMIGDLLALIQLLQLLKAPFTQAIGLVPQFASVGASVDRLRSILNMANDKILLKANDFNSISLRNISFSYGDRQVFQNINLDINKGDKIALIGYSGCGKTTLAKIIVGLLSPIDGEIITITNKENFEYIPDKLTSYVPQSNLIFTGSIKDNLLLAVKDASDDDISTACEIACVNEFVQALPNGIDTVVGEKGCGLSQGQVARIAIARALLVDAPIIVLDEITSSLDKNTEQRLVSNLCGLQNKTLIVVTHAQAMQGLCNVTVNMEEYRS